MGDWFTSGYFLRRLRRELADSYYAGFTVEEVAADLNSRPPREEAATLLQHEGATARSDPRREDFSDPQFVFNDRPVWLDLVQDVEGAPGEVDAAVLAVILRDNGILIPPEPAA